MPSNYITGTMTTPSGSSPSAYGAMAQAVGASSTGFTPAQSSALGGIIAGLNANKKPSGVSGPMTIDEILNPNSTPRPSSGRSVYYDSSSAPEIDYLYADLAKHYGLDAQVAYQEALTNTQYSRAVQDMKRAGLNPASLFAAGKAQTADSGIYPSSGSSGGSGRRSYGRSSGNGNNYLFSNSAYSIISALGGIVGAAATKSAGGYWIGTSLTQGAMSALNALTKGSR